jgi:hypothetical protein
MADLPGRHSLLKYKAPDHRTATIGAVIIDLASEPAENQRQEGPR